MGFRKIFRTLFGLEEKQLEQEDPGYSLMRQHSPTLLPGQMVNQITWVLVRPVWQPISKVQTGMMQPVARTTTLCARKKRVITVLVTGLEKPLMIGLIC